ncbi:hypothetical protein K501DRAFT_336413 [Backusella circina FSU 941]|nr:hypothetical protein K501DRAFT_336413 [Backusella circina FSU 941]
MARGATCLWVIPARLAVCVISFLIMGVSAALIAITFLHRNPMMMHLSALHVVLPWVYIIVLAVTALVGLFGMVASLSGQHGMMVFYKILFWLMTILIVFAWQIILFVLALTNRTKTTNACNDANPDNQDYNSTQSYNVTVEGYTTSVLGMQLGNTYGLANCDQAVQAGIVGLAILLFVGGLFMSWFAFVVGRCASDLDNSGLSSRARKARWDDNLDNLQSAYAKDRASAPTYPMKKNDQSIFSRGLMKMKLKGSK